MAEHAIAPEALKEHVAAALGALAQSVAVSRGEVTVIVAAEHYLQAMQTLRDAPASAAVPASAAAASPQPPSASSAKRSE